MLKVMENSLSVNIMLGAQDVPNKEICPTFSRCTLITAPCQWGSNSGEKSEKYCEKECLQRLKWTGTQWIKQGTIADCFPYG